MGKNDSTDRVTLDALSHLLQTGWVCEATGRTMTSPHDVVVVAIVCTYVTIAKDVLPDAVLAAAMQGHGMAVVVDGSEI